jgi:peptide/nickel transport system substrate-binding protein
MGINEVPQKQDRQAQSEGRDVRGAGITRRRLLTTGLQGAALAAGGGLLAACSSSGSTSTNASSTAAGKPVRGGTLTLGLLGAGASETVAPSSATDPDAARTAMLYDLLFGYGADLRTTTPRLAVGATHNSDATVWTIELRKGVTWHDGKPFTADDVVWTIQSWQDPKSPTYGAMDTVIDYKGVRKRDSLTVEIPLVQALAQFPGLLPSSRAFVMTPNGVSLAQLAAHPIGTGAWAYKSFTPGQSSNFVANDNYWGGRPYADNVIVNSTFSDDNSRLNALLSGQLNVMPLLPPLLAQQNLSNITVNRGNSAAITFFAMDITSPQFKDPRVRQALKLATDRQALAEGAYSGYATVANDLIGLGTEFFADDLKPTYDPDQAKSLLNAAGADGLTFSLPTSSRLGGGTAFATLWSQQLSKLRITANVDVIDPSDFYGAKWPYSPIGQDYASGIAPVITGWYRSMFSMYNYTKWGTNDPLQRQAMAQLDEAKAADLWHEVQQRQVDDGGFIVPVNQQLLDGVGKSVHNLQPGHAFVLNNYENLTKAWVS